MKTNDAGSTVITGHEPEAPVQGQSEENMATLYPGALGAEESVSTLYGAPTPEGVSEAPPSTGPSPSVDLMDAPTFLKAGELLSGAAPVAEKPVTNGTGKHITDIPVGTVLPPSDELATSDGKPKAKPKELKAGDHVHHYELIRELGKGGMGSVFLARDDKLGRRVAIKFLHTQAAELTKRFVLEARTTARFSHENIVTIFEVDEHGGQPFMVLEFLEGKTLTKLLGDGKPMPIGRVVELMVPVVRALASAHEQGIVHRDLKFDNVVVTDSGTIKVLDFGIAKVLHEEQQSAQPMTQANLRAVVPGAIPADENLTQHGTIMGTLAFMSPEQWKGVAIDNRTDIWAAGIMLFRMLSGVHPLAPLTGMALSVTARVKEPMPRLQQLAPEVPAELAAVVDRCLFKPKDERWPDALSLLRALEPFLPGRYTRELKIDESPYAGLSSFQESDADRFFGRAHEVAALVNRIHDQPLIAVVGPSGTGKSSFVRAGLVPSLKRSGEAWETLVIRPGRNPLAGLADIISPMVSTSASVNDELDAQQRLIQRITSEPGYVGSVLRSRARREKRNIMVFVDQFEELYTLVADSVERHAFTACLASIADDATSPTRVVLSIRSDFLDRVPEDPAFTAELTKGLFFLTAPANDGLRDALVQPAEMAGYRFETPEIVEDMLGHLQSTQGALPLLQFAATKLWESRDPARKLLTRSSYDALGGIAGALASHADRVLAELSPQARTLVRAIFLRLVTPERTRAIVSVEDLLELNRDASEIQRLIDQLVQARLLVVQTGGGGSGASAEIVHESLIHSWPMLKRWLDETGEDSAFLDQLRTAAKQWQSKGHDAGLLWRGEVVEEAHRFQRRYRGELPKGQAAFLDAVFSQEVRAARRKRTLAAAGVIILGALAVAAAVALVVIRTAQKEAVLQAKAAISAETDARKAEAEARKSLVEVQAKERERAEAAKQADVARVAADKAAADAQEKSAALAVALNEANLAGKRAASAQKHAELNAKKAASEEKKAQIAAAEAKRLANEAAERAHNLEKQLGSPVIDTLK